MNITFFKGCDRSIPQKILYQGHLVVRGEASLHYRFLHRSNDMIEHDDEKICNPSNGHPQRSNWKLAEVEGTMSGFMHLHCGFLDDRRHRGERMTLRKDPGFDVQTGKPTTAQKLPGESQSAWMKLVESGKMAYSGTACRCIT